MWSGILVTFVLAQTANHASWQRYHEPMLLMMIVLILARSEQIRRYQVRVVVGSVMLAAVYLSISVLSLIGEERVEPSLERAAISLTASSEEISVD